LKAHRLVILVVILAFGLSACDLPFLGKSSGGPSLPGIGDNTSKAPDQLLKDSVSALKAAKTYHLKIESPLLSFDFDVQVGTGAQGKVTIFGSTAEFISTGGKEYGRTAANKPQLQRLGKPEDTWVVSSADNTLFAGNKTIGDYDFSKILGCFVDSHGTLTKGKETVVNDVEVVEIKDAGDRPGSTPSTIYVAKKGTPYPIQVSETGSTKPGGTPSEVCKQLNTGSSTSTDSSPSPGGSPGQTGSLTFSDFGKKVDIKAPSNTIDSSQLGSSGGFDFFGGSGSSPSP
jgi:hypothetical protein